MFREDAASSIRLYPNRERIVAMAPRTVGFVYVITNDLMPGVVKIGLTSLLPDDRAKDLYTTGVPVPFEIVYRALTSRPEAVERQAHELLRHDRVSDRREFFRVPVADAIDAVRLAAIDVAGIASWASPERHMLRAGDRLALTVEAGQVFVVLSDPNIFATSARPIDFWQAQSYGDLLEIFVSKSATHVAGFSDNDPGATEDPVPYLNRIRTVANGLINGRERLVPGERLVWLPTEEKAESQKGAIFEASDYCQIVSRTWSPMFRTNGMPLLFNEVSNDQLWPAAIDAVREALRLPTPRSWVPREDRGSDWEVVGSVPLVPEEWLPQLKPRSRK